MSITDARQGAARRELQRHGPTDGPVVYVTGHSLGGCLTTTIALHLLDELPHCIFQVDNLAGPTAGLQDFADLFDAKFGGSSRTECSSWRVVNIWDAVPNAWATISELHGLYPDPPGPCPDAGITKMINEAEKLRLKHQYLQPSTGYYPINATTWTDATRDANITVAATTALFLDQAMFQHFPNFTYMPLLDVPELGAAMTACSVGPAVPGTSTPPPSWSNAGSSGGS